MIKKENISYENYAQNILIQCPLCKQKKILKIPIQIIDQNKQLTTISVPSGLVCKHSFQLFVDKNYKVRGYQKVDFELSRMEFYEDTIESIKSKGTQGGKKNSILNILSFSQDLIKLLRDYVDGNEILGSSLFTIEGKILYSSLPLKTLFNTIREFEVRNEKNLIMVKKYFLVLENDQKIFSQFIQIGSVSLIITLIFSNTVRLGMGDLYLKEIIKKIQELK
ncbi:MAG: hypothetical protein ACFFAQ_14150 [Promethearchaeota archaeon]